MSKIFQKTQELYRDLLKIEPSSKDDLDYFIDKAITKCHNGNIEEAIKIMKRIKLMNYIDIIYRLTRSCEIDWNDKSLGRNS